MLSQLINLGKHHISQFQRLGKLDDVDRALECISRALSLVPDDHPEVPLLLINLGASYGFRYQCLGKLGDLEKAIEYGCIALTLTPDSDPNLAALFTNMGALYHQRSLRLDTLQDLEQSIEYTSRALALTPNDHPGLTTRLMNLGTAYSGRFERTGELDDLEKAVEFMSTARTLTKNDHPIFPSLLLNLGVAHSRRYDRLGELADLEKTIECESRALALTPDGHSYLPEILATLGSSEHSRFERLGEPSDLGKSIEHGSRALALTPDDHPRLMGVLDSLGSSHTSRFERLGELADIEKAIECKSRAVALAPDGHRQSNMIVALGNSYYSRFQVLNEPSDLDKAIECVSRALSSAPHDHRILRSNLGSFLKERFQRLGNLEDLEKSIEYSSHALASTPSGHPDLTFHLVNLAGVYNARFQRLDELADLEKAIEYGHRALGLTPKGHQHLPHILSNLVSSYSNRFQRLGELCDIDRSIEYGSRVLTLTPDGHPDFPFILVSQGQSYGMRFRHAGEPDDIKKSIECISRALSLTPDNHHQMSFRLESLAYFLNARAERWLRLGDFEDATTYALCAVASTPDGHPDLPKRYHDLAKYQFFHSLCTGDPSQMQKSMDTYRQASQPLVGAPKDRFLAAWEWAAIASKYSPAQCIEAFQTAIDLLPQYIWLGATASQRYLDLDRSRNLATSAVSAAIRSSEYTLALKWLEQARCVVWNQNLMLQSPLNRLQSSHPTLAPRIRTIATQLQLAGSKLRTSGGWSSDVLDPEQAAQQHRRLAKEYSELLSGARTLPGFEDFLQPARIEDLTLVARNGPVAVVNCCTDSCDALLILPGYDEVIHVLLPSFTKQKALWCRSEIEKVLRRRGIRERGVKARQEAEEKDHFASVLGTLWCDIVQPILEVLGCENNASGESLPHITWCPTGALSFLPLHAAGDYSQPGSRVFDYVISSYTPTLTALLSSTPSELDYERGVLAIGQSNTPGHSPLPGTTRELAHIKAHTRDRAQYSQLTNAEATTTAVFDAMESHDWVHLACHAHQNIEDPTKSGFFLHDGTLDLNSINRRSFKNKGLAFLSACQTAAGYENLPDEAVHLASGMLMAGYTSVIATMWSVNDADAPLVADKVYAQLMKDGKLGNGEAGRALHHAIEELRNKVGEKDFGRWVPYIHIGS